MDYLKSIEWHRYSEGFRVGTDAQGRHVVAGQGSRLAYNVEDVGPLLNEFLEMQDALGEDDDEVRATRYANWASKHGALTEGPDPDRLAVWDATIADLSAFSELAAAIDAESATDIRAAVRREWPSESWIRHLLHEPHLNVSNNRLSTSNVIQRARTMLREVWAAHGPEHTHLTLDRVEIDNLAGLMWMYVRDRHRGGKPSRVCRHCSVPFWPSAASRGGRDRYCSNKCRQANYRRGDTARKLRRAGMTPAAITKRMNVEQDRLNEWIRDVKPEKKASAKARKPKSNETP